MTDPVLKLINCEQAIQTANLAMDDLCKTYSTPHCHLCLERMADAVLLLDNEKRGLYASSKAEQILSRLNISFTLNSKFTLPDLHHASRFAAFVKHNVTEPLVLLLTDKQQHNALLFTCVRLPDPSTPNLQVARYLITLRDLHHYAISQWQLFTTQFTLTQAEARLCHDLADGLTLNDYCSKWHVTINTARSQLHGVFAKTNTQRQSDLLRLMYLFTRV